MCVSRCNGIAQAGRGGMVRRNVHVNSSAMPPGGGHSLSDSRLKFSERLKAYLSVDRERSDVSSDAEDPYQFSDGDVCKKVRGMNGAVSRSEVVKSRVGVKMEAGLDTKHSIIGGLIKIFYSR